MKSWILPSLAVGAVVFLMTRPGRDLQEQVSDNFNDWTDGLVRCSHNLQQTLNHVQTVLERFSRTLREVGD